MEAPFDFDYEKDDADVVIETGPVVPDTGTPVLLGGPSQQLQTFFGPPGTGKTTELMDTLEAELSSGHPPDDIAFVSFTNAACDEVVRRAIERFSLPRKVFPYFRTLHSLCWRIMGAPTDVLTAARLTEFAEKYGYRLSGNMPLSTHDIAEQLASKSGDDDPLLAVLEWSRARRLSLEVGQRKCPVRVPLHRLLRFKGHLDAFKEEKILHDFSDMIEFTVFTKKELNVSVAFIDEAQDLSPLQITAVELLFRYCDRVYVAGDDDQCIYTWAGADPSWLIHLEERSSTYNKLPQSYRVPDKIQALGERIIKVNKDRVSKTYEPRTGAQGKIARMSQRQAIDFLKGYEGTSFVLARNSIYLKPWSQALMERGIPFLIEGPVGASVQDSYMAAQIAAALAAGQPVNVEPLLTMFEFVPSRGAKLLPRGIKKKLKELAEKSEVQVIKRGYLEDLGLAKFLEHLDANGPVDTLSRLPGAHRKQLKALLRRYGSHLPDPKITLSTIHRSKGQERDCVVLIPDMTKASFEEFTNGGRAGREGEHRVAYVAVTRAYEQLILVDPMGRRYFPYAQYLRG